MTVSRPEWLLTRLSSWLAGERCLPRMQANYFLCCLLGSTLAVAGSEAADWFISWLTLEEGAY